MSHAPRREWPGQSDGCFKEASSNPRGFGNLCPVDEILSLPTPSERAKKRRAHVPYSVDFTLPDSEQEYM